MDNSLDHRHSNGKPLINEQKVVVGYRCVLMGCRWVYDLETGRWGDPTEQKPKKRRGTRGKGRRVRYPGDDPARFYH